MRDSQTDPDPKEPDQVRDPQRTAGARDRELRQQDQALRAATAELTAFVQSVVHDLRAPLHIIQGFGEALGQDEQGRLLPESVDHLARIHEGVDQMNRRLDGLAKLTLLSVAPLERVSVDLGAIAEDILAGFRRDEPDRDVQLSIAPRLTVSADRRLMHAMLEHLLGNAWKFTERQRPAHIEFGGHTDGAEMVVFVRDDGVGFPADRVGQLFLPFRRLHSSSDFPGTGLGLASVLRIVRRHGGRVWGEGQPGQGATFWFTLPIDDVAR